LPFSFSVGVKKLVCQKADHPKVACVKTSSRRMANYCAEPGMSMQSLKVSVTPAAPRSVEPGVNVADELVVTLIKPTKVVPAVT
jgi:hypothetical protein